MCPPTAHTHGHIANSMEFDILEALTIDQSTDELVIIHHISKRVKSLNKLRNFETLAALSGIGLVAHVIRFKSFQ